MKVHPCIDEEGVTFRIRHTQGGKMGVVEDGCIAVDGNDIAVRRVIGPLANGFHISQVDLELARPRHEGVLGRDVATHTDAIRFAQALQLVGGLVGAVIVQIVEHGFRVGLTQPQQLGHFQMTAQISPLLLAGRQVIGDLLRPRQEADVEEVDPEGIGQLCHLVPEIHRPVEQQHRLAYTIHQQPAVGIVQDRQPGLEVRIHLEGIILIVEEDAVSLAGVDGQAAEPLLLQYVAGTMLQGIEVLGKKLAVAAHGVLLRGKCDFSITSSESRLEPSSYRFVR